MLKKALAVPIAQYALCPCMHTYTGASDWQIFTVYAQCKKTKVLFNGPLINVENVFVFFVVNFAMFWNLKIQEKITFAYISYPISHYSLFHVRPLDPSTRWDRGMSGSLARRHIGLKMGPDKSTRCNLCKAFLTVSRFL